MLEIDEFMFLENLWKIFGNFKYINTFFAHTSLNPIFNYTKFFQELIYASIFFFMPFGPIFCYLFIFLLHTNTHTNHTHKELCKHNIEFIDMNKYLGLCGFNQDALLNLMYSLTMLTIYYFSEQDEIPMYITSGV